MKYLPSELLPTPLGLGGVIKVGVMLTKNFKLRNRRIEHFEGLRLYFEEFHTFMMS